MELIERLLSNGGYLLSTDMQEAKNLFGGNFNIFIKCYTGHKFSMTIDQLLDDNLYQEEKEDLREVYLNAITCEKLSLVYENEDLKTAEDKIKHMLSN